MTSNEKKRCGRRIKAFQKEVLNTFRDLRGLRKLGLWRRKDVNWSRHSVIVIVIVIVFKYFNSVCQERKNKLTIVR